MILPSADYAHHAPKHPDRRYWALAAGLVILTLSCIPGAWERGGFATLPAAGALFAVVIAASAGGLLPGLIVTAFGVLAQMYLLYAGHPPGWGSLLGVAVFGIAGAWISHGWEAAHTRYRRVQSDLLTERQRRLLVDESLQDFAIARVTPNGLVTEWTRGAERIFGYSALEIAGRHLSRFYPDEDLQRSAPERDLEEAGTVRRYETDGWRVRRDRSVFWANVVFMRQQDASGALQGWLMVCRDTSAARREQEQLLRSQRRLRDLAAHLESVREAERAHIAREIHDELGQALTCLKMDVAWCQPRLGTGMEPVAGRLQGMRAQIDQTISMVRRIATELRPKVLDELGLAEAIEWQAREFSTRTGIECSLNGPMPHFTLDRERSTAMFRVFQETLTNVARHAGATRVSVAVFRQPDELRLEVRDNGRGITEAELEGTQSLGLLGMRERIAAFRGTVSISGKPGKGSTVVVQLPWTE